MKCAECGNPASKLNSDDQPVCSKHVKTKVKMPACPNCKLNMVIRTSKFGAFWGCMAFPMCDGMRRI